MLHTQYRPTEWADFVGNEKAVSMARGALASHRAKIAAGTARDGLVIQITGLSGAGKTTMAQLLAAEAIGGLDNMDYMELDGDRCNAESVRALQQTGGFFSTRPWGLAKALIVNESHSMTARAVQAWLTLLERLPKWALVIFTSTEGPDVFGEFSGPFARRCINIPLTNQGLAGPFAARLVTVAAAEGYTLDHKAALRIVQEAGNNLGRAISNLEGFLAANRWADAFAKGRNGPANNQ